MLKQDIDNALTDRIIGAFYDVYNALGSGFLEKVYERALLIELEQRVLTVEAQKPIKVNYKGNLVGEYFADICVENTIIIEIKAVDKLKPEHEMQLVHYLKATGIEVGLLFNFGPTPEVKRKLWTKKNPC